MDKMQQKIEMIFNKQKAGLVANLEIAVNGSRSWSCLLYTSPSPRDLSTSRMPSSA